MGVQKATAEDIAQDAMLAALKSMHTYRGEAPFTAWVMRIAARLYFKRYAKEARTELMAEPVDPETPAGAGERDSQLRLDLDRALSHLSKGERTCVSLCHGAGMTHEEIAGVTGLPLGTVKSHVNRGLAKLRRLMAAERV